MKLLENAVHIENEAGKTPGYQVSIAKVGHIYPRLENHFTSIDFQRRSLSSAREIKDSVFLQKRCNEKRPACTPLWLSVDGLNVKTA